MKKQVANLELVSTRHPRLKSYYSKGLGAFRSIDKSHIEVPNTNKIRGSLALDDASKDDIPVDARWDYVFEYDSNVFFIEIHPGVTSEVQKMIQKVDSLRNWLKDIEAPLLSLPPGNHQFYWVSSGNTRIQILPTSAAARRLAAKKIVAVGTVWRYSKVAKSL